MAAGQLQSSSNHEGTSSENGLSPSRVRCWEGGTKVVPCSERRNHIPTAAAGRIDSMADNMTPAQRSRTMSLIRSKNTQPELQVRRRLHLRGLRYRVHVSCLPGKPDIVFSRQRIVVFIDGDY